MSLVPTLHPEYTSSEKGRFFPSAYISPHSEFNYSKRDLCQYFPYKSVVISRKN